MNIVRIALSLIALIAVGCNQPEADLSSGTVERASAGADLASVPIPCERLGETVCGDGNGANDIKYCGAGADGQSYWYPDYCPNGCIHSTGGDGLEHDHCSQCDRGPSYCENGQRWSCGSDGYYQRAGACSRCDCGGTYPKCRICQ